jgi:hypothetical protein
MSIRASFLSLPLAGLLLVGCSGGSPSQPATPAVTYATRLDYTDPAGTGFRWVRNAESTSTRLVLDLVGPAATVSQGVAFSLTADTALVDWTQLVSASTYSRPGTVLDLGATLNTRLYREKLEGSRLQVGLFQKAGTATLDGTHALVSVALTLRSNVSAAGVALTATTGFQAISLAADGTSTPINPALGTLAAR